MEHKSHIFAQIQQYCQLNTAVSQYFQVKLYIYTTLFVEGQILIVKFH